MIEEQAPFQLLKRDRQIVSPVFIMIVQRLNQIDKRIRIPPAMRQLQESSAPQYERTRLFRIYEHTALPGLFHTAEYSMEIMSYWVRFLGLPDDAEAATAARLARQKVLRSGRRRFIVVLAEQTLRTRLGTPQVMTAARSAATVSRAIRLPTSDRSSCSRKKLP